MDRDDVEFVSLDEVQGYHAEPVNEPTEDNSNDGDVLNNSSNSDVQNNGKG